MSACTFVGLTLFGPTAATCAQAVGPKPDSAARAFYAERSQEYEKEARAMVAAVGKVTRLGGELRLRLGSGKHVTLADTLEEGDSFHRFVYAGFDSALGLHVIVLSFYEGGTVVVYHDRTGNDAIVPGLPIVSPDGKRFVSASIDLEASYDPNRLEIWRVDRDGLHCEAMLDGGDKWGPDEVHWVGSDTVAFLRTSDDTGERRATSERLVRKGARWRRGSSASLSAVPAACDR